MGDGAIRLTLPASPEYSRVVRTALAGLALRLGFSYPAIEDLRLAIDEVLILLLRADDPDARVVLEFEPTDDGLVIDVSATAGGTDDERAAARLRFEQLVAPMVDSWSMAEDQARVHLVKHRG